MKRMSFAFILMTSIFFTMNAQEKEMTMNASVSIGTKSYSVTAEDNDAAKLFFRQSATLPYHERVGGK